MSGRLRTSRQGLDLIKSFEGFRPAAARLSDGRFTIGYGHVRSAREGVVITERDAEDLLRYDLLGIEEAVNELAFTPLSQNQFDALASLVFNISPGQFKDSHILHSLNAGDYIGAAAGFDAWRKARINGKLIVVDALVRRRAIEKAMFLEPDAGRPAAPTPMVTPELDTSAVFGLRETVVDLGVQVNGFHADEEAQDAAIRTPEEEAIAEAIRKLVEQGPSLEAVPEIDETEDGQLADEAPAPQPTTPEEAARLVGLQLQAILDRAEKLTEKVEASTPSNGEAAVAAALEGGVVEAELVVERVSSVDPVEPPAPPELGEATPVNEQIERIRKLMSTARVTGNAPSEPPPPPELEGQPVQTSRQRPRIYIDDTEVFDPGRDPAELFAESAAEEARLNGGRRLGDLNFNFAGLGPWFVVLGLALMGVVVGLAETVRLASHPGEAFQGPLVVLAVFGLMLVMSVYFIATKAMDPER